MNQIIKQKNRKNYNFSKILLFVIFLSNIDTGVSSIEDADEKKSRLFKELRDKRENSIEKKHFVKKFRIFPKVFHSFKSNIFLLKNSTSEPKLHSAAFHKHKRTKVQTKMSKQETSPFKLNENFMNKIRNYEEDINNEISIEYFRYQNPSCLAKH